MRSGLFRLGIYFLFLLGIFFQGCSFRGFSIASWMEKLRYCNSKANTPSMFTEDGNPILFIQPFRELESIVVRRPWRSTPSISQIIRQPTASILTHHIYQQDGQNKTRKQRHLACTYPKPIDIHKVPLPAYITSSLLSSSHARLNKVDLASNNTIRR